MACRVKKTRSTGDVPTDTRQRQYCRAIGTLIAVRSSSAHPHAEGSSWLDSLLPRACRGHCWPCAPASSPRSPLAQLALRSGKGQFDKGLARAHALAGERYLDESTAPQLPFVEKLGTTGPEPERAKPERPFVVFVRRSPAFEPRESLGVRNRSCLRHSAGGLSAGAEELHAAVGPAPPLVRVENGDCHRGPLPEVKTVARSWIGLEEDAPILGRSVVSGVDVSSAASVHRCKGTEHVLPEESKETGSYPARGQLSADHLDSHYQSGEMSPEPSHPKTFAR